MGASNPIKIAICGKFRSGKDAVAEELRFMHGFEFPIAFGSMLKYFAAKVYTHTPKQGDGKNRAMYQMFGQACRAYDPDVWIRHAEFEVNMALEKKATTGIVISDLRQPNEYEWCKANGFVIVRVNAPESLRIERAVAAGDTFSDDDLTHETEQHVDKFEVDYEINNDGLITDIRDQVAAMMDDIRRKGAVE